MELGPGETFIPRNNLRANYENADFIVSRLPSFYDIKWVFLISLPRKKKNKKHFGGNRKRPQIPLPKWWLFSGFRNSSPFHISSLLVKKFYLITWGNTEVSVMQKKNKGFAAGRLGFKAGSALLKSWVKVSREDLASLGLSFLVPPRQRGSKEPACPRQELQETRARSLDWEDPLEEEMATCPSNLAWKAPWTEEPGQLQSKGIAKSWTWLSTMCDWITLLYAWN